MFVFNVKYNLITYFCILLMIIGCQNTKEKLVIENKISTKLSKINMETKYEKNSLLTLILK